MATQTIKWMPSSSPNIVAYEILKTDDGRTGTFTRLALVLNMTSGPNYNSTDGYFFYVDEEIPYRYYRMRVLDSYGNIAEDAVPTPFQAGNDPVATPSMHYVAMAENTGGQNNLQYVTTGGTAISGASIRVYKKIDWDTRNLTRVVGTAVTNAAGGWSTPVFVEAAETYTIVYHKPNEYGPDSIEVTV